MRVLAIGLAAIVVAATAAGPARANTSRANTDSYSRAVTVVNTNAQTCVHYTLSGRLKYTAKRYGPTAIQHTIDWRLENVRIVAPTLTARTYKYDPGSHACTTRPQRWVAADVEEHFAGFACGWNPSISISAPWGVGISFWPSCSRKDAGVVTTHRGRPGTALSAAWDAASIGFPVQHVDVTPKGHRPKKSRCYGVVAQFDFTIGSSNRQWRSPVRHKICPTPHW